MNVAFLRADWVPGVALAVPFVVFAPAASRWSALLVGLYLVLLLPRVSAARAALASAAVCAALVVTHIGLMGEGLASPLILLLAGHALLASRRLIAAEGRDSRSAQERAEADRMLGIAYQAQGKLDAAWKTLAGVPASEPLLENLYSLAGDFDNAGQPARAEAVYAHLQGLRPGYRDVQKKLGQARERARVARLEATVERAKPASQKPKFGAFEVGEELGRGAMGKVYRGRDPVLGRDVAIKTLPLEEEFDADVAANAKARFFKEVQIAGGLSHPNIVTIYDTGEEQGVCYVAMELLEGGDLGPYTRQENLLPAGQVASIIARAAEALGHAHRQGVVHYDVRPGNILYHAESDTVKVSDFGIARLTASAKTRSGVTLGAPAYMSPEQHAGADARVDGRSDLYSLGVTLYQLLCGRLPFEGESTAQLVYRIANEPAADIRGVHPGVPAPLAAFLERALAKLPEERFQSGEEFSVALQLALDEPAESALDIQL